MKYKFNDTFIELGFIKELLKEFNLPNIPVAVEDSKLYIGKLYIKDLGIYRYLGNDKFQKIIDYYFNRPILNLTRNMSVTTSYYSTDFHEYLGEYLRFIRDYKHLNLMSLYNCFSNRVIFTNGSNLPDKYDDTYNYYAIPVKFGQSYTIGFDSEIPVEMFCTLWDQVVIGEESYLRELKNLTSFTVQSSFLTKPFIYTKLKDLDATKFLKNWDDLKLIIKIPQTNDTSITVLEGDYIFNTKVDSKLTTQMNISFESKTSEGDIYPYHIKTYPTYLSLFNANDKQKHPFADRLLEYLFDMAITPLDKLEENIKRAQNYIMYLTSTPPMVLYGVWDQYANSSIYSIVNNSYVRPFYMMSKGSRYTNSKTNKIVDVTSKDVWKKSGQRNLIDVKADLLMYVDKDVEGLFLATGADENERLR